MAITINLNNEQEVMQYLDKTFGATGCNSIRGLVESRLQVRIAQNNKRVQKLPVPKRFFLGDMVMYPVVDLMQGNIMVSYNLIETVGLTESEIFEIALDHSLKKNIHMTSIIPDSKRIVGFHEITLSDIKEYLKEGNLIMTSTGENNGASSVLLNKKFLKSVYEQTGKYFIIPSSIHEILLFQPPTGEDEISYMKWLVREMNETNVEINERLSDSIYYFDGALKEA
ncbi:DUF5688 family protein [Fusibacillus kribbianus]|uniref:DUF5688 family protein n=1 Tax=Fusibacillus kribbianus TaxID=3044208 RepID=A0AAP4B9B9_9FIRM|nr:DUF5688 family protein [Ruminococcus sp. YH-rum2234]MDI9241925.1 DUF5688 family protein [Ruminococcus sp. YH-rum2234]